MALFVLFRGLDSGGDSPVLNVLLTERRRETDMSLSSCLHFGVSLGCVIFSFFFFQAFLFPFLAFDSMGNYDDTKTAR